MVATIESLIINLFLGMVSPIYDFFFHFTKEVNNNNNKFVLKTKEEESECYYVAIFTIVVIG